MRRSLLHSRRLRCFFEADSRTPFRHSPLREETAFREKPHFPAREALLPCFFCHPAEIPRLRSGRLPCLRPIAVPPQRNPLHTESHASDTMFSQADRLSSRNTAASGSKNRASKPCRRKPVRENLQERSVPYPSLPCSSPFSAMPHGFRPTSSGIGTKEKPREIPKSSILRLPDESSSASAAPKPSPPRRSIRRAPERKRQKRIQRGISLRKNRETDRSSIPQPPDECLQFRAAAKPNPPTAGVPMRTEQETVGQGPPLRNTVKPLRSSGRTTKRFRLRVAQTEFFPLPGPADRAPSRSRREALRNTESRPDSPAARQTVSGSGLRKQSFFPCPDRPIELRAGAAERPCETPKADPIPQPQDEPFPAPGYANRAFPLKEHFPMKFEPEAAGEFPDKTGTGRQRPSGSNRLPPNMPLFQKRGRRERTLALAAHALSVERPATAPGIGPSLSEAGPFVPELGTRHGQRFTGLGRPSLPRPTGRTHGTGRKRGRIICSRTPGVGWR